jgi:hypothetical protein
MITMLWVGLVGYQVDAPVRMGCRDDADQFTR